MITPAAAPEVPAPAQAAVLGEFIAHVSPKQGTITFARAPKAAGALQAEAFNELTVVDDGVAGSGSTNTVELITNSVGYDSDCAGFPTKSFCGNVTLRSFLGRSINNAFVQVISVYSPTTWAEISGHYALNQDTTVFGLDDTKGLWEYTGSSEPLGVLGEPSGANTFNSGARDWVFSNPDDADTYIKMRVIASTTYSDYNFTSSTATFLDACSGQTPSKPALGGSATATMPFTFTLYTATSATVKFSPRGIVTIGGAIPALATNYDLPHSTNSVTKPGLFVFWDDLAYNASGSGLCTKTFGSAPNRQFVIEWQDMTFNSPSGDKPADLTFEAILSEGTNNIDVVYSTMTSANQPRADGNSATIGFQNVAGTVGTASYNTEIGLNGGVAFQFEAVP
ncbi:MAG: hypothetical protein ABJE95_32360 [Byssovorax sp.]